jgi:hypothetical protein
MWVGKSQTYVNLKKQEYRQQPLPTCTTSVLLPVSSLSDHSKTRALHAGSRIEQLDKKIRKGENLLGSEINFTKFHLPHILFCNSVASYFKNLYINAKVRTSVLFHFSSETAVVLQYIVKINYWKILSRNISPTQCWLPTARFYYLEFNGNTCSSKTHRTNTLRRQKILSNIY